MKWLCGFMRLFALRRRFRRFSSGILYKCSGFITEWSHNREVARSPAPWRKKHQFPHKFQFFGEFKIIKVIIMRCVRLSFVCNFPHSKSWKIYALFYAKWIFKIVNTWNWLIQPILRSQFTIISLESFLFIKIIEF